MVALRVGGEREDGPRDSVSAGSDRCVFGAGLAPGSVWIGVSLDGEDCGRCALWPCDFVGGASAVAFDGHLEGGGMMEEAVDGSHGGCFAPVHPVPFAEGLVCGDSASAVRSGRS